MAIRFKKAEKTALQAFLKDIPALQQYAKAKNTFAKAKILASYGVAENYKRAVIFTKNVNAIVNDKDFFVSTQIFTTPLNQGVRNVYQSGTGGSIFDPATGQFTQIINPLYFWFEYSNKYKILFSNKYYIVLEKNKLLALWDIFLNEIYNQLYKYLKKDDISLISILAVHDVLTTVDFVGMIQKGFFYPKQNSGYVDFDSTLFFLEKGLYLINYLHNKDVKNILRVIKAITKKFINIHI